MCYGVINFHDRLRRIKFHFEKFITLIKRKRKLSSPIMYWMEVTLLQTIQCIASALLSWANGPPTNRRRCWHLENFTSICNATFQMANRQRLIYEASRPVQCLAARQLVTDLLSVAEETIGIRMQTSTIGIEIRLKECFAFCTWKFLSSHDVRSDYVRFNIISIWSKHNVTNRSSINRNDWHHHSQFVKSKHEKLAENLNFVRRPVAHCRMQNERNWKWKPNRN